MGRRVGSRRRAPRGPLNECEDELVWRLVRAYPKPVDIDRAFRLTCGGWSPPQGVRNMVHMLRTRFGADIIETVRGVGFRASERLIRAAADEARSRVLGRLDRC